MKETPWSTLSVNVKKQFKTVSAVLKENHLDYNVSLRDCYLTDNNNETLVGERVPKVKVSVRDDTNEIFGLVGERYVPLNNMEAFGWFHEFTHHKIASIESVGLLGNIVFMMAKVNKDPVEITEDDPVQSYITLLNSFDGSTSVFSGFSPVRMNTMVQMPKLKTSVLSRTKHTKNALVGLERIREIMGVHNLEFTESCEQLRHLASKQIKEKQFDKYVRVVMGDSNPEVEIRESRVESIKSLFEGGRGVNPEAPKTYYGAYQAIAEFLNYETGRSVEARLRSLWMGSNAVLSQKALNTALKLAK